MHTYTHTHTHTHMYFVDGNLHFISGLWTWHEPLTLSQPVGEFLFDDFSSNVCVCVCVYIYIYIYIYMIEGSHINTSFPSLLQSIPVLC
jgi:hypothetical protein